MPSRKDSHSQPLHDAGTSARVVATGAVQVGLGLGSTEKQRRQNTPLSGAVARVARRAARQGFLVPQHGPSVPRAWGGRPVATVTPARVPPWRIPGSSMDYRPAVPYKRLVLSPRATQEVYDQTDPGDSAAYILIDQEGMLRAEGHLYGKWPNVRTVMMWENMVVYNCRSSNATRVVWQQQNPAMRSTMNLNMEPVKLIPDPSCLDSMPNVKKVRRIFKGLEE